MPRKAFFGTQVGPVTKEVRQRQKLDVTEGVVFVQVFPRTTAAEADFKPGDVILSVDGSKIADIAAFLEKVRTVRTGDTLTVEVVRDGARSTKKVTMREKPRETSDAYDITYGQVSSRGSRLRTIVTRPKAPGQHPAVLLIQGYGCVSIDNLIGELDPYGWLARDLTLHGYVVMRVDRPGCGDSEGGPCKDVDFETELDGYRQALKALKGFAFVDADNVFLFGHSMGGIMAPFLAADDTVKGVAVYGTTSRSWFQVILELRRRVMMFD
ncbi:MAG TPA: alpha/beta fold hydrolase, partial [Gemmataceae bacterium]|nr:alpha/beta fold hydrolase [Gemmataceae bacterium]